MRPSIPTSCRLACQLVCIVGAATAGLAAEPGGRTGQVRLNELSHSSPEVRITALRDLQTSLDPRIPEAMIPLLADEGTSIRRLAARAIGSRWWQIPKARIPAYLTALRRNQRHEKNDLRNMTARAIGLLKRDYRGEMFARSRNKQWVVYERRGHPCLIDTRTHSEELLGWSANDRSTLSPRLHGHNMPPGADSVLWHLRKELVAFHMNAGRRPLGVWVWSHPVVSRNSITTESADARWVGMPAPGPISDRESSFGGSENAAMDESSSLRADRWSKGRGEVNCRERLGGLLRYFYRLPGGGMKSTIRVFGHYGVRLLLGIPFSRPGWMAARSLGLVGVQGVEGRDLEVLSHISPDSGLSKADVSRPAHMG